MGQKVDIQQQLINELNDIKTAHLAGRVEEAIRRYEMLLMANPTFASVLHPLGIAYQQIGHHAKAADAISQWLSAFPDDYDALINLSTSLLALNRGPEAAATCQKAASIRPEATDTVALLAQCQQAAGDLEAAERTHRQRLAIEPGSVDALFKFANFLTALNRNEEAASLFQQALAVGGDIPEIHVNLANCLARLDRGEDAIRHFNEALRIRPGMPEALLNLGNALFQHRGDIGGARNCFELVLTQEPTNRNGLNNLTSLAMEAGDTLSAVRYARRMLEAHPLDPLLHTTAASVFLALGQWEEGWQHFEWRWLRNSLPVPLRDFGRPEWQGEDISNKTILIHHEQGLGDSIQFVRFVQQVVERAGQVILEVPANLRALYARSIPGVTLATYRELLPLFDVQIAIMSLPFVLGISVDRVPAPTPYLQADPARVEAWRHRLPKGDFKVGIVWQGKAGIGIDKGRSYRLEQLAPVARLPGVTLISLQKGYGLDQLESMPEGMKVETLGPDFDEGPDAFLDTVAVMQHLDLIISSDTSVAHLAGALGRPVWVPLKFSPDWRWLRDREDSPWYPASMRLFRQRQPDDWPELFKRLAAEVAALRDGDRTRLTPPSPPPAPASLPFPPVPPPPFPDLRPIALLRTYGASTEVAPGIMESITRHGRMRYPATDLFVGRGLDAYGEWSEEEATVCASLLQPGDTVIEAGSNLGSHTLALGAAVGPGGRVHAFEPQGFINELLTWNVTANRLDQVTVHRAAVGSAPGELVIPDVDYDKVTNFGGISLLPSGSGNSVPVITIDGMGLSQLRLLKADVEGMELEVLRGAVETIRRCRPILYLENDRNDLSVKLIDFVRSLGYRVWQHHPRMFNPNNFRGNSHDIYGQYTSFNILCVPAECETVIVGLPEIVGLGLAP